MPDRIVIVDAHRANERIPTFELKQMMGRVSRGDDTKPGHVDFVLGMTKYEKVVEQVNANDKYQVESKLAEDLDIICFHLMPEIGSGAVRNVDAVKRWYERSLNAFQGNDIDIQMIVDRLQECNCVIAFQNNLIPTVLGQAAARFYFQPIHVMEWTKNFEEIFGREKPEIHSIAWALANISGQKGAFEPKEVGYLIEEYKNQASTNGLDTQGNVRLGLCWWYLLGGPSIRSLRPAAYERKKEWPRLYRLLRVVDKFHGWNRKNFLIDLNVRIGYRVSEELVELCKLGFNKTIATELYNMEVKGYSDLQAHLGEIECSENPRLLFEVEKVLNGAMEREEEI